MLARKQENGPVFVGYAPLVAHGNKSTTLRGCGCKGPPRVRTQARPAPGPGSTLGLAAHQVPVAQKRDQPSTVAQEQQEPSGVEPRGLRLVGADGEGVG